MPDDLYDDQDLTDDGSEDWGDDPSDYAAADPSADTGEDDGDDSDIDPSDDDSTDDSDVTDDDGSDDETDLSAVPYPPGLLGGGGDPSDSSAPDDPWAIPQVGILHPDFSQKLQAYIDRMGKLQDYLDQLYPFTNGPVDTSLSPTDRILADPYYHDDSDYMDGGAYAGAGVGNPFQPGVVTADGNVVPDWARDGLNPLTSSGGPANVQSLSATSPAGGAPSSGTPLSYAYAGPVPGGLFDPSTDAASSWAQTTPSLQAPPSSDLQAAAAQELQQRGGSNDSSTDKFKDAMATLAQGLPLLPSQMTPEVTAWMQARSASQSSQPSLLPPAVQDDRQRRLAEADGAELADPKVRAMLDTIGFTEGRGVPLEYDSLFGDHPNDRNTFDMSKHPGTFYVKGEPHSAAGRYQILERTYNGLVGELGFTDMSPQVQDIMAVQLLRESHALERIKAGDVQGAISAASDKWPSMPKQNGKLWVRSDPTQKPMDHTVIEDHYTQQLALQRGQ